MQKYRISFSGINSKQELHNAKILMPISISATQNMNQEGKRLISTLENLAKYGAQSILIVVADTLNRHNLQENNKNDSEIVAMQLGKEWLERNSKAITELKYKYSCDIKISFWNEYLTEKIVPFQKIVEEAYITNEYFLNAIQNTAKLYVSKYSINNSFINKLFFNSIDYLKEEIAVLLLWGELDYDFLVYPSKKLMLYLQHINFYLNLII